MYGHHSPLMATNVTTTVTSPDLRMFEEWWRGLISCRGPIAGCKISGFYPEKYVFFKLVSILEPVVDLKM